MWVPSNRGVFQNRPGLTYTLYDATNNWMFFEWKQRMIKLALLCALRDILAIWSENFISLSTLTPKSTACSTGSILWSFIVNSCTVPEWYLPSGNTQHLEYDIGSCQISAHISSLSSCFCKSAAVSNKHYLRRGIVCKLSVCLCSSVHLTVILPRPAVKTNEHTIEHFSAPRSAVT